MGPLHDPVTWYRINYTGTQVTQWDFQNKRTRTSPARLSFVLKVPLRNLRPSVIYSVPCDRIVQMGYCRKEIYIHVELCLQLQLFFKGSEVSRSQFLRSEISGSEFSKSEISRSEV